MLQYMDDWFGMYDKLTDTAWIMDDFGNGVNVDWSTPPWYYTDEY